jgi:DNA-directed RNA polymerase subunit L
MYKILQNSELKDRLWHKNKNSVRCDLIDSNEAFANGIRRVFNDELEIKIMFVHPSNLDTDDKFILPDNIIERINLIPIEQNIPEEQENTTLSLRITNDTGDIMNIYSKDILINEKKGGKSSKNLFNQNIILCTLRPGKYIYINNISFKKKQGFINNTYTAGTHRYECINVDFTKSSSSQNLKDFRIEFRDNGNIGNKNIIKMIRDNLYKRVIRVKNLTKEYILPDDTSVVSQSIENINEVYIIKNTNIVDLHSIHNSSDGLNSNNSDIYEIHIKGEYHTLGNIITKYVYLENKNIELINYKLEHILKNKVIICIKHSDYKNIINNALEKFLNDLDIWYKAFK